MTALHDARQVETTTGSVWDFSCPDWPQRLIDGRSLIPDLPLDVGKAEQGARVFNKLRLPDVEGNPLFEDAAGDWFRDIVRAICGSLDLATGVRMVSDVFLEVPKKNSKTTNGAGLMLTLLLLNTRPYARLGLFGPTQEISDIAFLAITGMINCDADLKKLLHIQEHLKTITNRRTHAVLKVTTFDPAVATGGKFVAWLLDEAHLLSKVSFAARVVRQLRGARVAFPESVGVIITTQSDEPPAGFFRQELMYARAVRDGRAPSEGYLPVLYEFPENIQKDPSQPWLNPAIWHHVLPNVGRSVNALALSRDLVAERAKGSDALRIWASQHLNIEIGLSLQSERWRGADYWEAAGDESLLLDDIIMRSDVCTVGIDGGGLDDLLGLAVIGRDKITGRWLSWAHAYVDPAIKTLRPEIAARLEDFERAGDLTFVEIGASTPAIPSIDPGTDLWLETDDEMPAHPPPPDDGSSYLAPLVEICVRLHKAGLLPAEYGIGLDPAGVAAITQALVDAEIPEEVIAAVPQGYRLSGTIVGVAIRLKAGSFRHGAQSLMAWCVGNAKSELRGSAIVIDKQTAGSAKIDPLMAVFDAASLMARNPQAARSVYSADRGLTVFG